MNMRLAAAKGCNGFLNGIPNVGISGDRVPAGKRRKEMGKGTERAVKALMMREGRGKREEERGKRKEVSFSL